MRPALIVLLALAAAACSGGPTAPVPFTLVQTGPSIAGLWRGQFEFLSCIGDTSECDGPAVRDFSLTLGPARTRMEGELALGDRYGTAVHVTGQPDADGVYQLEASRFHAAGFSPSIRDVSFDSLTLRETASGLEGAFTYTVNAPASGLHYTRAAVIRSATQEPLMADSFRRFDGEWSGYYYNRRCLRGGGATCDTGLAALDQADGGLISMSFARTGNAITGEIMGLPAAGTVDGFLMTVETSPLTGDPCPVCPDCIGVCQTAVGISAQVDKLGRMNANLSISRKGWNGHEQFLNSVGASFSSVVRLR
jgi:hypothetical protein